MDICGKRGYVPIPRLVNSIPLVDMKKYLKTYQRLLSMNASMLLAYTGNFMNSVFASLLWCAFSFASILLLTSRSPDVFGWSRDELMLLTAIYSVVVGFVHLFITNNMFEMAHVIRFGRLDSILLKPMDSQFMLSLKEVNYPTVPRVLTGCILVVIFLFRLHISPTISDIGVLILLSCASILFLYSFWFTVMVFTVYYPQLWNLIELLVHFSDIAKYPGEMYHGLGQFIVFLFPLTLIVSLPTKAVLRSLHWSDGIILVCFSIGFFLLSRIVWKHALRSYTSASS